MWVDQGWHPRSGAFDTLCFAQPQKIQPSTVTGLCPVFNPEIEYKPSDAPMVGWGGCVPPPPPRYRSAHWRPLRTS